ncbi:MAG: hypothetical protein IPF92_05550 [Myxococcales bacterium]|nr:hypothetical protein [Myxococcales bacterium]MBL0198034.1 hypothetical protein [Myxococcales bacterium]HQY61263.1 hypothetical protein [Polyangiaceae bacterium]
MRPGRFAPRRLGVLGLCAIATLGCKKDPAASNAPDAAAHAAPSAPAATVTPEGEAVSANASNGESAGAVAIGPSTAQVRLRPRTPARAGEVIAIPAGVLLSGTLPSDDGRDPAAVAGLSPYPLGAFSIDALPFPNDPARPPKAQVSRDDAAKACQERGARLCTDLEWERACKGPDADTYATGPTWDPACEAEAATCASGFGARAMGGLREWVGAKGEAGEGAPFRGGGPREPGIGVHRCARRGTSQGLAADLGFRCCTGGERPKLVEVEPFRKTKLDASELAAIVAGAPELAGRPGFGAELRLFDPADSTSVVGRTQAPHVGLVFSTQPLLWSPDPGVEVLVVTGRSKTASFVLALFPLSSGKYKIASYFVMLGDVSPVALAYNPSRRRELQWTTCWGCSGETGGVSFREDRRIVIVQF